MSTEEPTHCVDCNEPDPGSPGGRCRDCDIEYIQARSTCRECLRRIRRADVAGPVSTQHREGCALAFEREYWPRNDDETWAIREKVCGSKRPEPQQEGSDER